jgi:hypothetical protein
VQAILNPQIEVLYDPHDPANFEPVGRALVAR